MKWLIRAYAAILLAYTGWRTYDFMIQQLPAGDLSTWLAIFFLFATEIGLVLWHELSLHYITTQDQHYISVSLTWVDFVGSLSAGVADMILRQSFYGGYQIPAALALFLLYGLPAIVAVNVAGVLFYLSNDAEVQLDRAKKELHFEITRQALRELRDNQGAIAETMKLDIFRKIRDEVTGKVASKYAKSLPLNIPINGKEAKQYNAEAESPGINPTAPPRHPKS
jgi:hypothetical protein